MRRAHQKARRRGASPRAIVRSPGKSRRYAPTVPDRIRASCRERLRCPLLEPQLQRLGWPSALWGREAEARSLRHMLRRSDGGGFAVRASTPICATFRDGPRTGQARLRGDAWLRPCALGVDGGVFFTGGGGTLLRVYERRRGVRLAARGHDDRRGDRLQADGDGYLVRIGCQWVKQRHPPWATDRPSIPAGAPNRLSAGSTISSSAVSASRTRTARPSTLTCGADGRSPARAHVRSSASVVPLPSNVLHSTEFAATKIRVPGFTVHDDTPVGPNGATVPSRLQHPNASPPVPNEFCALGVWSTTVHNAPSCASSFFVGVAAADGAAADNATAAISRIRTRRHGTPQRTSMAPGSRLPPRSCRASVPRCAHPVNRHARQHLPPGQFGSREQSGRRCLAERPAVVPTGTPRPHDRAGISVRRVSRLFATCTKSAALRRHRPPENSTQLDW
jgi:hypothetical protein